MMRKIQYSNEELTLLWKKFPNNEKIRNVVITGILKNNRGMIEKARQLTKDVCFNSDDYMQYLAILTIKSLDAFEISRGNKFLTYYTWILRSSINKFNFEYNSDTIKPKHTAMQDGTRKLKYTPCESLDSGYDYDSDECFSKAITLLPENKSHRSELESLCEGLTEKEKKNLFDYYGVSGGTPLSLGTISNYYGVSKEAIRQSKERILKKCRQNHKRLAMKGLLL